MDFAVIETYINDLMEKSTAEIPVWNIEKARAGKKSGWDYIDGCMIMALLEIYDTSKDKKYLDFADYYEDYRVKDDGSITGYDMLTYNLDEINGAKNFFRLFDLTSKQKYRKALDTIYKQFEGQPRTKEGNFWHKKIYPNQIWLDGLYMGLPFYMEYEARFNNSKNIEDIYKQFATVHDIMRDPSTGLYYHGYDSSRKMFWADRKTGLSKNFWLRSLGWYSMAMLDTLTKAPDKNSTNYNRLKENFCEFMEALLNFQNESGMWYQVPNKAGVGKNYLETSGSAILAYSMMKGSRLGMLEDKFSKAGKKAFEGICSRYLKTEGGVLSLDGICLVGGLGPEDNTKRDGSFEYYMSEPIVKDDAKGVGPFILAYNEYKLITK